MLSFIGKLSLEEELELADSGKRNNTFSFGEEMVFSEETILELYVFIVFAIKTDFLRNKSIIDF